MYCIVENQEPFSCLADCCTISSSRRRYLSSLVPWQCVKVENINALEGFDTGFDLQIWVKAELGTCMSNVHIAGEEQERGLPLSSAGGFRSAVHMCDICTYALHLSKKGQGAFEM